MMKKLIAILLLGALLTLSFVGCNEQPNSGVTPNNADNTTTPSTDTQAYKRPEELDSAFTLIEQDKSESTKISFFISDEEYYYELKDTGLYPDSSWTDAYFQIIVHCNYSNAVNETWYKETSQKDTKSLNEAFYNFCKDNFSKGTFTNISFYNGLYFTYGTPEDFLVDYDALKSLLSLSYVVQLEITYHYPVPIDLEIG